MHAVARRLGLSWDQAAGIQRRAVERGLSRRELKPPRVIGVDETSFRKRHEYVTVVNDLERGVVTHVADGRGRSAIDGYFEELGEQSCAGIEQVAMDMWPAYISSVAEYTDADIVHDRFHIVAHLNHAVDLVRRAEQRELLEAGDSRLKAEPLPVVDEAWGNDGFAAAAFRRSSRESSSRGPRLGDQGDGALLVGLRAPRLGRAAVEALVQLGRPQPPGTDQAGGEDDQEPLG